MCVKIAKIGSRPLLKSPDLPSSYVHDCISTKQDILKHSKLLSVDFLTSEGLNQITFGMHYITSRVMRKGDFAYAKTKAQISFAVTAKLNSAFFSLHG